MLELGETDMAIRWREQRSAVAAAARRMAAQGLTLGASGNVSARLPTDGAGGALMAITPSRVPYDTLRAEDIPVTDMDVEPIDGDGVPSSEALLHAAIYRRRSDVGAVMHTHSTFATIAAVAGMDIPVILNETALALGGAVRVSEYAFPSSDALAANALAALGERNAALIRNHGAVGVGADLTEALEVCALVERAAQVFVYATLLGGANPLPADVVDAEIALFRMRRQSLGGNAPGMDSRNG